VVIIELSDKELILTDSVDITNSSSGRKNPFLRKTGSHPLDGLHIREKVVECIHRCTFIRYSTIKLTTGQEFPTNRESSLGLEMNALPKSLSISMVGLS